MPRKVYTMLSKSAPNDSQEVYIRVKFIPIAPFKAVWYEAYQTFITSDTGQFYPPWTVTNWKPV
jgi:hypothetical protein